MLNLKNTGIRFVAADLPEANEMVVGIMSVVAEAERHMISVRTKAALAAAKARGTKLGIPANLTNAAKGQERSREARATRLAARAVDLAPILADMGPGSLRQIATALNERSIPSARVGPWSHVQVARVMSRIRA